jgi:hypothetical protein
MHISSKKHHLADDSNLPVSRTWKKLARTDEDQERPGGRWMTAPQ